ncbi:MAG: hypothetical protein LAT57_01725 [Balneolales bacterium]|nr:hypothetical protein [Balneolales bacterium]
MITLLADQHIPYLNRYLDSQIRLVTFDPLKGLPQDISADALFVRTVTKINEHELSPKLVGSLKFTATASAGTDHVDATFLNQKGIEFKSAAGCNSRAVAEYVATGLLHWCSSNNLSIKRLKVGIVGVGNAGSAVNELLLALGTKTVLHDPPRTMRDPDFKSSTIEDILHCDVITFHVPLVSETDENTGYSDTRNWLNQKRLAESNIRLVINASRGGVVDEKALKDAYISGKIDDYILDVWVNEPIPISATLQDAYIGTPHIAGYSIQAKHNATAWIAKSMYDYMGITFQNEIPTMKERSFESETRLQNKLYRLDLLNLNRLPGKIHPILEMLHPMFGLSSKLKESALLEDSALRDIFSQLRTGEHLRNEYTHIPPLPEKIRYRYPELEILTAS